MILSLFKWENFESSLERFELIESTSLPCLQSAKFRCSLHICRYFFAIISSFVSLIRNIFAFEIFWEIVCNGESDEEETSYYF